MKRFVIKSINHNTGLEKCLDPASLTTGKIYNTELYLYNTKWIDKDFEKVSFNCRAKANRAFQQLRDRYKKRFADQRADQIISYYLIRVEEL